MFRGRAQQSRESLQLGREREGGSDRPVIYRAEKKSWQILLSSTQAGPGRKVKQEQEEISRNHVPRLFLGSVQQK